MTEQGIERHFTKMAAIGRSFQLGDFYDYRSDNILTGKLIFNYDDVVSFLL